jgi:hypothetical protein
MNPTCSLLGTSGAPGSHERMGYLMLFCALLLAHGSKATLEQSLLVVPLAGGAKSLADGLVANIHLTPGR